VPLKNRQPFVSGGRLARLSVRTTSTVAVALWQGGWRRSSLVPHVGTSEGCAVALSASEARKRLFPLIEQVNDDEEAVEIVSKSGTAFLVPEQLWRSLVETRYLLRSPANARRLLDSVARVDAGEFERHDLLAEREETGRQAS
jgi:antitoxin YefM